MTEINYLSVWFSIVFFVLSASVNMVYLFVADWNVTFLPVVINIAFLVVFCAYRIFVVNYAEKAAKNVVVAKQKIGITTGISSRIGLLMQSAADDEDVLAALRKLKESVDCWNSIGTNASLDIASCVLEQLLELGLIMDQKRDKDIVLNRIAEISKLWKEKVAYTA